MTTPRERAGFCLSEARMRGSQFAAIPTADLDHLLKLLDWAEKYAESADSPDHADSYDPSRPRIGARQIAWFVAVSIACGWVPVLTICAIRR